MANNRPHVVDASTQTVPDVPTIISDAINFANRSSQSAADGGQNASNANTAVGGVTDNSGQPGFEADHSTPQCSQQEHVGPQPSDAQVDSTLDPALLFPNPTFSLGLTHEARLKRLKHANVTINTDLEGVDEDHE
ncbi:BnaC04g56410D [Brassica napus]|uniref:BnaC04g56410D protein n=1 Tax=Brassica napus TaxID=3708 RepID=A0A078J7T5_BRANA|nr:BnaC04g56410D [Brassica napus]